MLRPGGRGVATGIGREIESNYLTLVETFYHFIVFSNHFFMKFNDSLTIHKCTGLVYLNRKSQLSSGVLPKFSFTLPFSLLNINRCVNNERLCQ